MRRLFERTDYEPPAAQGAVYHVADLMRRDLSGAAGTASDSAAGAIAIGWFPAVPIRLGYLVDVPLIVGMLYGVYNQRHQAQVLEDALSRLPAAAETAQASSFEWFRRSPKQ